MLWSRNKPLTQPPTYGRVGYVQDKRYELETKKAAERALSDSHNERNQQVKRHGGNRAVVQS